VVVVSDRGCSEAVTDSIENQSKREETEDCENRKTGKKAYVSRKVKRRSRSKMTENGVFYFPCGYKIFILYNQLLFRALVFCDVALKPLTAQPQMDSGYLE
jgi:hypothetical protein